MGKITLSNIRSFVQGYSRDLQNRLSSLPWQIEEQFIERANTCEPCLKNGGCVICGCKTPQLFLADKGCPAFRYPAMRSEEQWRVYKDVSEGRVDASQFNEVALLIFHTPIKGSDEEALKQLMKDNLIFQDLQMYVARWFHQSMQNTPQGVKLTLQHKVQEDLVFEELFDYTINATQIQKKLYEKILKIIFTGITADGAFSFNQQDGQLLPTTSYRDEESKGTTRKQDSEVLQTHARRSEEGLSSRERMEGNN